MKTIPIDLRARILAAYDGGEGTRQEIADRFQVSLAMVKKLLQQRKKTGDIRPRPRHPGRYPKICESDRRKMKRLLDGRPDMSLRELREALGLKCSLPAIHYELVKMNLTYKQRQARRTRKTLWS